MLFGLLVRSESSDPCASPWGCRRLGECCNSCPAYACVCVYVSLPVMCACFCKIWGNFILVFFLSMAK
uniref:Uncharacterized protein n=1 Tax=Rhizophora mucronata TaxID=61149 RepID=A0A2P2Q3J0_RHIMU